MSCRHYLPQNLTAPASSPAPLRLHALLRMRNTQISSDTNRCCLRTGSSYHRSASREASLPAASPAPREFCLPNSHPMLFLQNTSYHSITFCYSSKFLPFLSLPLPVRFLLLYCIRPVFQTLYQIDRQQRI